MSKNEYSDSSNIERCTANENYSIVPNEILQDATMSSEATMVLLYLLSCKPEWVIKPINIWKSKNISRDHVYRAFDELIGLGYMDKIISKSGNLNSTIIYKVSFFKKFLRRPENQDTEQKGYKLKKCFRHPEIQDTEIQHTEIQDALISNIYNKEDINKDNVCNVAMETAHNDDVKTMSFSENNTKKDDVKTMSFSENKKAFKCYLTPEQSKLHDALIKYQPALGDRLKSDDVCAWFLSCKYTVEQVEIAFKVYKQDAQQATLKGRGVDNMGGCMVAAIKSKRAPQNEDLSFNRDYAQTLSRTHRFLEVMEKYVKIRVSNLIEEIMFNLPKTEFMRQINNYVERAKMMEYC